MESKVKDLLVSKLPNDFNIMVSTRKNFDNTEYIRIGFSPNTTEINRVKGQFPQLVSFSLDLTSLELTPQIYGGMGGQSISRDIDPTNEKEKFYTMKTVKVPFRKPKNEEKFILSALDRFVDNYMKTLKDNFELLRYKDLVDYSFLDKY